MDFNEGFDNLVKSPHGFTSDLKFPPYEKIKIFDTTLRDGEQCPGVAFSPVQKLEIAKALDDIGVHIIDIGFPAASKSDEKAFELIYNAKKNGEIKKSTELLVTARAKKEDVDYVFKVLLENAAHPSDVTFFVFTSGSDLQVKYKIGRMLLKKEGMSESLLEKTPVDFFRKANIRMLVEIISFLKGRGVENIEAGCAEDGSRADVDYIVEMSKAAVDAGAIRIAFADTVGVMTPQSSAHYFSRIRDAIGDVPLVAHCHDDFDLATINTITALGNGATVATCTVNGIGERAGNASLHSVLGALWALYGIKIPNFKYEKLNSLSEMVENFSGVPLNINQPVVGRNVYTHESGIHSAAQTIDPRMYQHMNPDEFGGLSRFIFGKHSGRNAVKHVLDKNSAEFEKYDIKIDDDLVNRVVKMVKAIREKNQQDKSSETIITRYYKVMDMLGINEEKLVELAVLIGHRRGW
ncbi:homoaconitate hydratase [bacterium]|nr:homoaconitate hydratase [bacterium]MBU1024925.1 homoaconitate hydratase [bacterium]